MKKIFRFFPVALAVFALSSCTTDDLQDNGVAEYQLGENEILVTVGEGSAFTRAAFGESISTTDNKLKRSVFWTDGDQIKLYDQANWMTQTYKFNESATKSYERFQKADEVTSVFTLVPKPGQSADANKYEDGYAVYPNSIAQFEGEDRSQINFNLDNLACFTATELDATKDDLKSWNTNQDGRVCGLAMWGNLSNKKLQLNYLTAFVRVETQFTVAAVAGQHIYAIVNSNQPLTGKFTAAGFDYTANASPVLTADATDGHWTAPKSVADLTDATTGGKGDGKLFTAADKNAAAAKMNPRGTVVIDLGEYATAGTYEIKFYAPIPAAATQQLAVYLTAQVPDATTSEISCTAAALAAPTGMNVFADDAFDKCPKKGNFFKIDKIEIPGINTPHKLQELIKELDAVGRDMTVTLTEALKVKNDGKYETPITGSHNYLVDLSDYDLKHNITLNFANGIIRDASSSLAKTSLEIKTKAGEKKLTLNFGGASALDTLVVNAESPIDLASAGGALPSTIRNYSNNMLTIKAPAQKVVAFKPFTIDGTDINTTVQEVVLCDKVGSINLKTGTIYMLRLGVDDPLQNEKLLSANATINSEAAKIAKINTTNMPQTKGTDNKYTDDCVLNFISKYVGVNAYGSFTQYTTTAATLKSVITTASQLAGWNGAAVDAETGVYALGTFYMNSITTRPAITATKSLIGAANIKVAADANTFPGVATIDKLAGAQGLLNAIDNSAAVTVKNLKFTAAAIETADNAKNVGILAGSIAGGTDNVTIANIELAGSVVAPKKSEAIGGVIGLINTASAAGKKVQFAAINSTATVEGYKGIGGIVGMIATNSAIVEFAGSKDGVAKTDKPSNATFYNTVSALPTCHQVDVDFSENYLTNGKYIGTIATKASVTVYVLAAPQRADRTNDIAQWLTGTITDAKKNPIHVYNDLIGFSGIKDAGDGVHTPQVIAAADWTDVIIKDKKDDNTWNTWTYKPATSASADGAPVDKKAGATTTLYLNWVEQK